MDDGVRQQCPNCEAEHDVSIFVSGQRVRCSHCGIRFEVLRENSIVQTASAVGGGLPPPPVVESIERSTVEEEFATDQTTIRQGLNIPGYEIDRVLGRGGMGEVYLARQESLSRMVAIKVLSQELARQDDFVIRFEKEAAALAALSHPNIVGIIDRGRTGDTYFFVMDFVEGHSLREMLRDGPLPPDQAVNLIAQVCNAIEYAHSKGVIHRDLKPENILIDMQGQVKVADFGLAGIIGGDERLHLTKTDTAMGTFQYMAPEQRRNSRDVDGRADLFSLGVMLYELITGEVPVGMFKLPSERMDGLDPRIDDVIRRAMESDPADRYQRASAIYADLESMISASRITSTPMAAPGLTTPRERPGAKEGGRGERVTQAFEEDPHSVVRRAEHGIKRLAQVLLAGLALAGVLLFVFIGREGRQQVRELVVSELGPQSDPDDESVPQSAASMKIHLTVPLKLRVDGRESSRREIDFEADTSGDAEFFTYRGDWKVDGGALVHDVFQGGKTVSDPGRVSRAFLGGERFFADGYRLEVTVRLRTTPPAQAEAGLGDELARIAGEQPAQAKLYLYRNKRHFWALTIKLGEEGGYTVSWNLGDDEHYGSLEGGGGLTEPAEDRALRVELWVEGTWIHAKVDGQEVASGDVGLLGEENWGKAGLGCWHAVCTFDDLIIEGRTRAPPGKKHPTAAVSVEPVER